MKLWIKNGMSLLAILLVFGVTVWAVQRFHTPGQLDVITAQAMDMSAMRPPTGAAPIALASIRRGSLDDTVTYTGTVLAWNEQDVSPRITGTLVALPVYPGDRVRAGQVVAQLDTAEVGAKAAQSQEQAREAKIGAQVAHLTHHLHHQAALAQANAQTQAATQGVADAQAEAQAANDESAEAQAEVAGAQANAEYWKTELPREMQLADAGAVSRQEAQNEQAQAQASDAAVSAAQAKARQAKATAQAARAKISGAQRQVEAAQANARMAAADLVVAEGQARQASAGAAAAQAAAREAAVVQGYARIQATVGGIVTARPVAPGTLVQPGTTLLRIAEIDRVRIQAPVAVSDLAGIGVGTPVQITPQGDNARALSARVSAVFPAANDQTRTAIVETVVPNPDHRLLPGAFVVVRIARNVVSNRTLVPASAVVMQGGSASVWTTKAGSLTAHQVAVQTGASDGTWTEITSGSLPAGARVVTQGQAGLTEGTRIVATAWGADGPKSLPTAAQANQGRTTYRCEKCGMTYSEADAKHNHFIDPMDGGKLAPVEGK